MTTLTNVDLLDGFRDYMVAQDVVRVPRVPGAEPPLWLEPKDGVPQPLATGSVAESAPTVAAAFRTGGVPYARAGGAIIRRISVDIRIRSLRASDAYALDAAMYPLLHDKTAWDMGGLTVIESLQVRELQRLGSDSHGFDYVTEYMFECYA